MTEDQQILYSERFKIVGSDYAHGGDVAARVKTIMKGLNLDSTVVRRLSIANFEAEMNVIMYADEAELTFEVLPDAIRVVVADRGQGIPDIELAMQQGYSTATAEMRERGFGAGLGLPNIKKNTDDFHIESTPGVGTTLTYAVRLVQS
jgi:anti-sigma regulatory factor (Ser/Thr protein kinase)